MPENTTEEEGCDCLRPDCVECWERENRFIIAETAEPPKSCGKCGCDDCVVCFPQSALCTDCGENHGLNPCPEAKAPCTLCGHEHDESEPCVGDAVLPDSGARSHFETGAVRDASEGKGFFAMIPPEAERRIARRFEDGARKYGPDNWRKGIPLSRYHDAMRRHLAAWALGKTDEDHLGAVGWNFAAAVWTERAIYEGRLPESLNDLPERGAHNLEEVRAFLASVAL